MRTSPKTSSGNGRFSPLALTALMPLARADRRSAAGRVNPMFYPQCLGEPPRTYADLQSGPWMPAKEGTQVGHFRGEDGPTHMAVVPGIVSGRIGIETATGHRA